VTKRQVSTVVMSLLNGKELQRPTPVFGFQHRTKQSRGNKDPLFPVLRKQQCLSSFPQPIKHKEITSSIPAFFLRNSWFSKVLRDTSDF
jgi:hypothetical protein